jgi:hypothetical protein
VAAGAGLAAYEADEHNRVKRRSQKKREQSRQEKRTKALAKTNATKTTTAKMELDRLTKINPSHLTTRDRKVRQELIRRQKDVIKGAKPQTLAKAAAKLGLRSIPGVGAFLTAVSSTPAGQGSARFGPGSKKNK